MPDNRRNPPSKTQRWTRFVILAVGILTFVSYMALSPVLRFLTKQDRLSAARITGVGTVEQIVPAYLAENSPMSGTQKWIPAQVWIRVNGRLAISDEVFGVAQLHAGGTAQVVYRIGRSGRLYIDRVEPMPLQSLPRSH